jgi:hypothetical protein
MGVFFFWIRYSGYTEAFHKFGHDQASSFS